jgi:anti-sigma regulatory factor (Ser/Thr protein kinase)
VDLARIAGHAVTELLTLVHDGPTTADVATLRRAVRTAAEVSGSPVDVHDLELVVSELAANAVLHGAAPLRIVLSRPGDDRLLLTVTDTAVDALPPQPLQAALAETGRGLMVVAAIATEWGWQIDPDGTTKTVWVELTAGGKA